MQNLSKVSAGKSGYIFVPTAGWNMKKECYADCTTNVENSTQKKLRKGKSSQITWIRNS
jgi:hypothetical protein